MTIAIETGSKSKVNIYGALLNAAIFIVALWMYYYNAASLLEAISFVTGAICVWLTVRENVWNFPVSLLNVVTFAIVYFNVRLYADASLQLVYFALTIWGWYLWLYGGEAKSELHIALASRKEMAIVSVAGIILTLILWKLLHYIGGSSSFWDAITASISLCAQWLLNRKRIETWFFWILADLIYVPLYITKGLYLTSILYFVFLIMCVMGLVQWRKTFLLHRAKL